MIGGTRYIYLFCAFNFLFKKPIHSGRCQCGNDSQLAYMVHVTRSYLPQFLTSCPRKSVIYPASAYYHSCKGRTCLPKIGTLAFMTFTANLMLHSRNDSPSGQAFYDSVSSNILYDMFARPYKVQLTIRQRYRFAQDTRLIHIHRRLYVLHVVKRTKH
jgi:hypothetical protein